MTTPTADLAALRREIRAWCADNVPSHWRRSQQGCSDADFVAFQTDWRERLASGGFLAPHWPSDWGGSGYSIPQMVVLHEEMARADAPRLSLSQVALYNAGPTILSAGNDEQKRRFLSGILNGDVWCQGFSEPDAGSDLAALKTRAVLDGDAYLVSGQKVWTSYAMHAHWCLVLVRTDANLPKHRGITYLILDMRSEGIDIRPIRQSTGASEFCEVFLDKVRVPVANRLGRENEGWNVALGTLAAERCLVLVEAVERLRHYGLAQLLTAAQSSGEIHGDVLCRVGQLGAEVFALRALCVEMITRLLDHGEASYSSVVKEFYADVLRRFTELGLELAGMAGYQEHEVNRSSGWESGNWIMDFVGSWRWSISGGTSEIQRNIIGERLMGLPPEPRWR
jgi:alkylation response protein AidB-like acyl-CoA dehydrogenase